MKILTITPEQIERAKKLYDFGALKGSITKGESNLYGAIGEILVYDLFNDKGLNTIHSPTFDYDIKLEGLKIDVKTKRTKVIPKEDYLCSISAFNTRQQCDLYFFVRVNENLKEAYLLGYKKKSNFFEEATFRKKGEIDVNGWAFKGDCYNLKIQDLVKFK